MAVVAELMGERGGADLVLWVRGLSEQHTFLPLSQARKMDESVCMSMVDDKP